MRCCNCLTSVEFDPAVALVDVVDGALLRARRLCLSDATSASSSRTRAEFSRTAAGALDVAVGVAAAAAAGGLPASWASCSSRARRSNCSRSSCCLSLKSSDRRSAARWRSREYTALTHQAQSRVKSVPCDSAVSVSVTNLGPDICNCWTVNRIESNHIESNHIESNRIKSNRIER